MEQTLTTAQFEALPEAFKAEYTQNADVGTATLKIENDKRDLPKKLSIAEEHLKNAQASAAATKTELEKVKSERDATEADFKKQLDGASGKEQLEALKIKYDKQLEEVKAEREAEKVATLATRKAALIKATADEFANEAAVVPDLFSPEFAKRLSVEIVDGTEVIRTVDADGKASSHSLQELKQEFLDNEKLAPILKAKIGSGSGAASSPGSGAAPSKSLKEMTATEEAEFEANHPEKHAAAVAAL
tara:strand:- start:19784 stop:20521 length:738 start_codon:yes stop_codon:yes gene_type:complete